MGKNVKKKFYTLKVSEEQLQLISIACDNVSRIYRGIPETASVFDQIVISKRTGYSGDEEDAKRMQLAFYLKEIKKIINPASSTRISEEDNTLFDIHQVIRHHFYKERGDTSIAFVDSSVSQLSAEELPVVKSVEVDELSDLPPMSDEAIRLRSVKMKRLKKMAEESWEGCDGCDEHEKNFFVSGFVIGYNRGKSEI